MIAIIFWMITSIECASDGVPKEEENQKWKGYSFFLHVLLPLAGIALLWGQRGIFSKLLLQLDRTCVSVYCPSLSKREKLLKWASGRLPSTWSSQARTLSSGIPELWKDGSLLCTLINSVVPGACPNPHRHWRKPPLHAQALAYKYLGLVPIFSEDELSGEFTINQERDFIHYLQKLQEAINKWPTKDEASRKFSSQYVARGMGLYTGEQYRKTVFYVYSDVNTKKRSNVLMYIRGPYGTEGRATISPFHNLKTIPAVNVLHDQLEATKTLPFKNKEQKSFLKTISLDFTSLINTDGNTNGTGEIPIQIDMEIDRAKVTYIPNNTGIYEINLISDGELLRGSPYNVQVINNTSGKRDSFASDCESVEEKITYTKRKILSKIIDCIDEKICIDDGKVSKIKLNNIREDSKESDNDFTITAITKKNDEIMKTEINCSLEDTESEKYKKKNALDEIKEIAERLKLENLLDHDINDNKTNNTINSLKIDSQHKIVKNCDEAKKQIINLLQQDHDEVDANLTLNKNVPDKNLISKLDINLVESKKYLKNFVNSTSKQEILGKILPSELIRRLNDVEDENNNSPKKTFKRITSKISFEVCPKKVKTKTSFDSQDNTSPICTDHIVPEVEKSSFNQLPVAERRKIFSKTNTSDYDNFTFSTSENDDLSKSKDMTFSELSVLNVLDSLRQSRKNSLSEEPLSLDSATSLPNMSLEYSHENTFRTTRDYWEKLSSRSSSVASLTYFDYDLYKKKAVANKNFFNKFNSSPKIFDVQNDEELTKSADDLLSIQHKTLNENRKYKSVDTSLEDCTIIPIEQRKKQLLKDMYEKERRTPKKINIKNNLFKKNKPKDDTNNYFSPIADRIETFDKSKIKSKIADSPDEITETINETSKKSSPKHSIKSQFKRAIKFFKNLEKNSKLKEKARDKENKNTRRRYSLDCEKKNNHKEKKGGSLKLQNISQRFAINNLYEDVFGNGTGSFRGTPNKKEVANSLASFPKEMEPNNFNSQEENSISYNLFVNTSKNKKRKSLKTLFDVNY